MTGIQPISVPTPDGRRLAATVSGPDDGPLVVVHHGTPGWGDLLPGWVESAASLGLRLVSVSRPGYAGSTRAPGRSVADAAGDVAAVADALGAGSFVTWGVSGGGPHALACAALLPDRVRACAVLAGVAPFDAEGLDPLAGMGQDNLDEFGAAAAGEPQLRGYLGPQRAALVVADPARIAREMASVLPPVDADVLTGPTGAAVGAWMVGGLRDSVDGWVDDDLAFVRPWGFDPAEVSCPVLLVQGSEDLMVPPAHVRWLAGRVGGGAAPLEVRELAGEGHISLLAGIDGVHAWLAAAGR